MKKIMLTAAIVCAAVMSQAADVKWGTGAMYQIAQGNKNIGNAGTAYFFTIDSAQYSFIESYATTKSINDAMSYMYSNFKADGSSSTLKIDNKSATLLDSKATMYGAATSIGTEQTAGKWYYAALIATYTEDGKDYYVANVAKWQAATPPATTTVGNMGTTWLGNKIGTEAIKWQSVPEPTSGLLLLLGVAGLALKRKRA